MDPAKQRKIASEGGRVAHQKGTAHEWTSEEARAAGRKGGVASHQSSRAAEAIRQEEVVDVTLVAAATPASSPEWEDVQHEGAD